MGHPACHTLVLKENLMSNLITGNQPPAPNQGVPHRIEQAAIAAARALREYGFQFGPPAPEAGSAQAAGGG